MPKVRVNDINIYYEIHGNGFPLVLIRGLSSDVYRWPSEFVNNLSTSFRVIIFDNRGAGRTDKPDIEYSIEMMANDTVSLISTLQIERAHILGFSMGGLIAQEIAISHPSFVEKLILSGTGCGGDKGVSASDDVQSILNNNRSNLNPKEALMSTIPLLFTEEFIENNPDKIEEFIQNSIKSPIPPHSYRRQLAAIGHYSSYGRFPEIKSQTFVIHGKKDILVPPENGKILAENIPGAKLILLDNLGHDIFSQDPISIAKIIDGLLK